MNNFPFKGNEVTIGQKREHPDKELARKSLAPKIFITEEMKKYVRSYQFPLMSKLSDKYKKIEKIGEGTFGLVFKGKCLKTNKDVALKKIIVDPTKDDGFPITALREIKYLQMVKNENVTELLEVVSEDDKDSDGKYKLCSSFYLVLAFCDHDLCAIIAHNKTIKLTIPEIKKMAKDLFNGLYAIHGSKLLHRDLKSANILLSSEKGGTLKIADFGLSRLHTVSKNEKQLYTNRVVTLWYRAPELLLGERQYDGAIDMWSAGCILSEFFIDDRALFTGNVETEVIEKIVRECGSINPESMPNCQNLDNYKKFNLPQGVKRRIQNTLGQKVKDQNIMSVIDNLLTLDPKKRMTADKALDHDMFFHYPMPAEDLRELFGRIKGKHFYEFTTGSGAHIKNPKNNFKNAPPQGPKGKSQLASNRKGDAFIDHVF
uniref:Protein kinase domain-containing protein n=1 Tax=Strongyloides papillosus TaxID=174720 RepID=A0A0N5BWE1_STREA